MLIQRGVSKDSNSREIALYLLSRVEREGAFVDRLLNSSRILHLKERERLFIRELVLGVLRWRLRLDHIIDIYYNKNPRSIASEIRMILRLGLFQIMFMDSVPDRAAVFESVNMAAKCHGKGASGLVNALLRRFIREGEPELTEDFPSRLSFEMSYPLWMVKRWITHFGEKTTESICMAGNEKHPVFIRVGTAKISIDALTSQLSEDGFEITPVPKMSGYYIVLKSNGLFKTSAFKKGYFTVQDPSTGMACKLLSPSPGETILDLCAAPGGKSTQCAEMMNNAGRIIAVDINPARLNLVKENAHRLGLKSIEYVESDALKFGNGEKPGYDRVLLDAPCTGTGVLSKRLDMKWRLTEGDVTRLAATQRNLLKNAACHVKPGGILVYSTCSLEPEENEDVIKDFLERHDEFSLEHDNRFKEFEIESGYMILPNQMNGTGAFAAKMKRIRNMQ